VRPRHGPIDVTRVMPCHRPIRPNVGLAWSPNRFLIFVFSPKFVFNKKSFSITKFKVKLEECLSVAAGITYEAMKHAIFHFMVVY
jgi:hypothetical protein